jgi:3-oxoacyl-(acyl-carrier-protein) synthase III
MAAKIIGTGSYFPDNIVTNDYLSTIVDTNDEWIRTRTGILERRISNGEGTSQIAAKAAKNALINAGIEAEEIEYIIVATMSGDHYLPNTACEVQSAIGAANATCFDINAACSGFVFALNTANAYIKAGIMNTALVIGAETLSRQIDWMDRSTCVLFGDGAGAVVLKATEESEGIISMVTGSNGLKGDVLTCAEREIVNPFVKKDIKIDYMKMDGQEVFKFAVKVVPKCIEEVLEKAALKKEEIKYFVLHQANKRILESVAKRLDVSIEAFPMNLDRYGNTSAASIPILLDEMNQKEMLDKGDKIILSGFGGGLTWGATLIEW